MPTRNPVRWRRSLPFPLRYFLLAMTSTTAPARLPRWLPALVILGAALTAAGGVIALVHPALLLSAGDQMNPPAEASYNPANDWTVSGCAVVFDQSTPSEQPQQPEREPERRTIPTIPTIVTIVSCIASIKIIVV